MKQLTFGSLFAGIGGFDLGFERAGMRCEWQVEIDDFCNRVLEKHWPDVRRWRDVRDFPPEPIEAWRVDVICGGPPCQPVSFAGKQKGESDERWLWDDAIKVIRILRPRAAVLENPPALLTLDRGRAFGRILADLAECGFDAAWEVLSACAFGAPHMRRRLFIVAHADCVNGRSRIWNPFARQDRSLQADDGTPRARPSWQARMANPSELYRDADGVSFGPQRNHAIGNALPPQVAEYIARRLMGASHHFSKE